MEGHNYQGERQGREAAWSPIFVESANMEVLWKTRRVKRRKVDQFKLKKINLRMRKLEQKKSRKEEILETWKNFRI